MQHTYMDPPTRAALNLGRIVLLICMVVKPVRGQDVEYLFHISIDGLRSEQLQLLMQTDPDQFTNFQKLVDEGATTFNARNDYFNPWTLPNHTSMITGRPIFFPGAQEEHRYHSGIIKAWLHRSRRH